MASRIGATTVPVFGAVLHGDDTAESDLDLLVDVPRGTTLFDPGGLPYDLEKALGIPVHVLTAGDINRRYRKNVIEEARPL